MDLIQQRPTAILAVLAVGTCYVFWVLFEIISLAFESNLRKIPGPFLSSYSYWPLKLAVLGGKRSVYIHSLHDKYGPFVRVSPTEVAIADIDAWRRIHRIGSDFRKNPNWYQRLSPTQYNDDTCSVFGLNDPQKASARRKLYQTAATKRVAHGWDSQIRQIVDLTVGKIKHELQTDGNCDVMKWWTLMAADMLGDFAFGQSFHGVENGQKSRMIQDVESTLPLLAIRLEIPWLYNCLRVVRLPQIKEITDIYQRLSEYSQMAVENTRQASKRATKTLFSEMIPEYGAEELSDSVIESEATNALFAGTDTVAMTLTYLVYAVLQNNEVQRKLVREIQAGPEHPTAEQLESMTYLNNVIREAMRRYPPIPGSLPRIVPPGGVTFDRYHVPAGTVVSTQAYTFHLDPQVFKDPLRFDPDRWRDSTAAMREHMMAFGGPVRRCLGENFARLELLHAVFKFFVECGDVQLASSMTDESMEMVDYFAIKPKAGVCIIEGAFD